LINNYPKRSINYSNFKTSINNKSLNRIDSVIYLGIYLDENLSWSTQIKHLSLQLTKYRGGMLYKLKDYVPISTLKMLYYSLIYSRVHYDITIWGTGNKTLLNKKRYK